MKNNILVLLILSTFLGSCTSNKKQTDFFPNTIDLQADSVIISPEFLLISRLFIAHDMLIAYEQRKDTMFSFWQLPECQYLFKAGTKGRGPNNFMVLDRVFAETDNGFKTFEIATSKVKEVKIDDGGLKIVAEQCLDMLHMPLNRFTFLTDSSYCFLSGDEGMEYILLDKKLDTHFFSLYPDLLYKGEDDTNIRLYNKLLVGKPDGEKFAAFYRHIKMLRIYNRNGEMLKELILEKPANTKSEKGRTIYYYTYPYATDKYIYVLENKKGAQKKLEVWSWDGTPVVRYVLNRNIDSFVVSEKYNKIYATSKDKKNIIYTYSISQ